MTRDEKKKIFFSKLRKILPKLAKARVIDIAGKEGSLIEQVHGVLLCTYIWTRKGNSWHDPEYPGYSKHVGRVLREFEKVL